MTSIFSRTGATVLAACLTGALALPAPAAAYQIIWPNQTFEQPDPLPAPPAPRKRVVRPSYPKMADAPKDLAKPRGPLIIAISVEKQHLKIYDANGLFAESPVSTGMRGHSTPMGVFSVIQKNKWHRSNLYSNAPMPYMQRITWSGVALHAGVVPGYPASHGCIRLPMAFATKLWAWTRLGARVIVAPGEVTPQDISHPVLFTHTPDASASVAPAGGQPADAAPAKPDKAAAAEPAPQSGVADLRLTPKHDETASAAARSEPAERIRLANADGALALAPPPATTEPQPPAKAAQDGAGNAEAPVAAANAPSQDRATDPPGEPSKEPTKTAPTADAKDPPRPADTAKDQAKDQPKDAAKDLAKDPAAKPETLVAATPKRTGHIAVLISRKENRLYVRQNFEPLFDIPVTIAENDRPLGTHVFTARADGDVPGAFRWSVTSLPPRKAVVEEPAPRRRHAAAPAAETPPAPPAATPAEVLSRLAIPSEAMTRIASAIAPGGSIVVSDQGLGGETGLGTDFIVPLR
ncbi:MAG: L,D-transpeptidase family protein [Pseudomonadota bacterium]